MITSRLRQLHHHWKSGMECCTWYSLLLWMGCLAKASFYRPMMWGFMAIICCWLGSIIVGDFLHSLRRLTARRLRQRKPWLVYGSFLWNGLQILLAVTMALLALKIYFR